MTASDKCTNLIKYVLLCRSHPHKTFENSFFQLLASFNINLQAITVQERVNGPDIKGADALELIYKRAYIL